MARKEDKVKTKEKGKDKAPDKKKEKKSAAASPGKDESGGRIRFSLRIKFSLAIIALVSIIIVTMAVYIVREESTMLREEIVNSAKRETEILANMAEDATKSKDELPLIAAMENLMKISSIRYAYVLDEDNIIRQNLDPRKNGFPMKESRITDVTKFPEGKRAIVMSEYQDTEDRSGIIYLFAKPIYHRVTNKREGTVVMGYSDRIIRQKVASITADIMFIAFIFVSISIIGSVVLSSVIIKPVRKLTEGAAEIGTGNLDYQIELKSSDELGRLAMEFNTMTQKLKKAKDMEIENRIMEEQIELAKEIQEGLNPMDFYNRNGVQIKGFTRAARGVGGDYFDYIDIDENMVGALISDVSGKGIPASLVMVMIRTVFTTYIKGNNVQCASVVRAINDSLSADFAIDKFATLFFMIYNRATGELSFSNAGHGPLFCYRSSSNNCSLTKLEGVPIGIMEDVEYNQAKVQLNVGDIVILYTDGVTEMRNESKDEYGRLRLQKMMIKNHEMDANELVEELVRDVDQFRGNAHPHDDMTMLVLKRTA